MAKHLICVGRPTGNGYEHTSIGNTLVEIAICSITDPEVAPYVLDVIHCPIQRFPTDVGRNMLVKICQERHADYLFMMDMDGAPKAGTFKAMFNFLRNQPEPSVIGVPYVSHDGAVQVFHFETPQAHKEPLDSWRICRYNRDLVAIKTGIERVASVGTHCCMFDMRVFDKLKKPYFAYLYNEDHTEVTETEDCYCMRHLFEVGTPVWCDFGLPAVHYKELALRIPPPVKLDDIPDYYKRKIAALMPQENGDGHVEFNGVREIKSIPI